MGYSIASATGTALVLLLCIQAAAGAKLRVRKEIRSLSFKEYKMYLQGLSTMISLSTDVGQVLFGPKYRELDFFVIQHAYNALTPNFNNPQLTNIGHFGPWFMNFHQAIELEYENSLLAVVPGLKAMPYFAMYEDMAGGRYYNTSQTIFGPGYAGSLPGSAEEGYAVMDGPFAGKLIGYFNYKKYGFIASSYNGSVGGILRAPTNLLTNPRLVRFPSSFSPATGATGVFNAGLEMVYNRSSWLRCADPALVRSSWDFVSCVDLPVSILSGIPVAPQWQGSPQGSQPSAFTHALFHSIVGSVGPNNGYVNSTIPFAQLLGDAKDLSTSPNEPMLFMAHHANIDRLWMIWKKAITKIDPIQASPNVLYYYPKNVTDVPPITIPMTTLYDALSPDMPFTDILPGKTFPKGVTHLDMLTWEPDYTYDDMSSPY